MLSMVTNDLKMILYMYKKRLAIFFILPIIFAVINPENGFFPLYMLMGSIMMLAGPEIESRDKAYITILSMPVKRDEYVYGKFISVVVWMLGVVVLGVAINKGLTLVIPDTMKMVNFASIKTMFAGMSIFLCLYMFVFFSLGAKAARIAYFVVFFGIICSYSVLEVGTTGGYINKLSVVTEFVSSTSIINNVLYIVIVLAAVGILAVLSAAIYDKKDL